MDAACGPSNPIQDTSKRFGRDSAHHRDKLRQHDDKARFREPRHGAAEADFRRFAGPRGSPLGEFELDSSAIPGSHVAASQQKQSSGGNDWARQFQNLHLDLPARDTQTPVHQAAKPQARFVSPDAIAGFFGNQFSQPQRDHSPFAHRSQLASREFDPTSLGPSDLNEESRRFDQAFDEVERRIQSVNDQLQDPESREPADREKTEDLRKVAQSLLHTVSDSTATEPVAEKFRQSEFFNLMKQFESGAAVVHNNDVVISEATTNNIRNLTAESTFAGPKVPTVDIKQPAYRPGYEPSRSKTRVHPLAGQQPLEDPLEYLARIKEQGGSHPAEQLSPFDQANALGPIPVKRSNWEEDYDDAVWMGAPPGTSDN